MQKESGLLPTFEILTVCFTSQPLDDMWSIHDGVLVGTQKTISRTIMVQFADHAALTAALRLNPNFADLSAPDVISGSWRSKLQG